MLQAANTADLQLGGPGATTHRCWSRWSSGPSLQRFPLFVSSSFLSPPFLLTTLPYLYIFLMSLQLAAPKSLASILSWTHALPMEGGQRGLWS